jgi:lysyl-tRNA synthetase class 2
VLGSLQLNYQGLAIDLSQPFRRAPMNDLVREATGVDFLGSFSSDLQGARAAALAALRQAPGNTGAEQAKVAEAPSVGHVLNECFEALVEPTLQQPTFVMDHPMEISPLAKPHRSAAGVVERFELFVVGRELANSFSELTDPVDQRQRLQAQVAAHRAAMEQKEVTAAAAAAAAAEAAVVAATASEGEAAAGGNGAAGKKGAGSVEDDDVYEVSGWLAWDSSTLHLRCMRCLSSSLVLYNIAGISA